MKASVILSTYNSTEWLEKVLVGFSVQTEKDFELIIADDGSTNETKNIIICYYIYQFVLMKRDHQLLNFKSWRKFFSFANKQYRTLIPQFFDYYRFDFHPNQTDEKDLVASTKIKIGLKDPKLLLS